MRVFVYTNPCQHSGLFCFFLVYLFLAVPGHYSLAVVCGLLIVVSYYRAQALEHGALDFS